MVISYFSPIGQCLIYSMVFEIPKSVSDLKCLYAALVQKEPLTICQDIYIIFMCSVIIISFTKLTSDICNILAPLYNTYFQQKALAVFKVVKLCLT